MAAAIVDDEGTTRGATKMLDLAGDLASADAGEGETTKIASADDCLAEATRLSERFVPEPSGMSRFCDASTTEKRMSQMSKVIFCWNSPHSSMKEEWRERMETVERAATETGGDIEDSSMFELDEDVLS